MLQDTLANVPRIVHDTVYASGSHGFLGGLSFVLAVIVAAAIGYFAGYKMGYDKAVARSTGAKTSRPTL